MSTLYIRLPSRVAADSATESGTPLYCQFALASAGRGVEREGVAALSDMAEPVRRAQRVVLLLAASDVTILRVKVPPLSASRLKAALPNLVEDQLISDPADCVVVAGPAVNDLRTVAVVHRGWMELLGKTMTGLGARSVAAVPSQLCLPWQEDAVAAAVIEYGADVEIAARLAEQDGIGLPIYADQPESAPVEAIEALSAVVPQAPILLRVPQHRIRNYEDALAMVPAQKERIRLEDDSWERWIAGADQAGVDLMTGLGMGEGPALNWRPWRWPLALAGGLLVLNAAALNIDWLRMKREADAQRAAMTQTYKAAYPKDPVIIDPMAQLKQKLVAAQRESGQAAPDDFVALVADFSEAWSGAGQGPQGIAGLEYHDRALTVKLKPGANAPLEPVKNALAARNLTLTQPGTGIWQIRSAR